MYNKTKTISGKVLEHKWENAFTVDTESWGYRRNLSLSDILTNEQILQEVVSTVSCGGRVTFDQKYSMIKPVGPPLHI